MSTNSNSTDRVVQLVDALVDHVIPSATPGMRRYCMRILGSRVAPTAVRVDFQVAQVIKKHLARGGSTARAGRPSGGSGIVDVGGVGGSLKFDELFRRLSAQGDVRDKWSVEGEKERGDGLGLG